MFYIISTKFNHKIKAITLLPRGLPLFAPQAISLTATGASVY